MLRKKDKITILTVWIIAVFRQKIKINFSFSFVFNYRNMQKKYPYFLIVFLWFILNANQCLALEVSLPGLPGKPSLTDYRNYLFGFLIGLGGALAVLSLIIGAIRYLTSAGNPEAMGDAKSRIFGSIFGLVLLLSSWVIIQTINPRLISVTITDLKGQGVFLAGQSEGKEILTSCPVQVNDTADISEEFNEIFYKCEVDPETPIGGGTWRPLWVRKFNEKNFGNWIDGTFEVLGCNDRKEFRDAASFIVNFEESGTFLYTDTGCNKMPSLPITLSQKQIDEAYIKKAKAFKFIPVRGLVGDDKTSYSAIFHSDMDFRGKCSPLSKEIKQQEICHRIDIKDVSSITVFILNFVWETSGDGVTFYSQPFGWQVGKKAGYKNIKPTDILTMNEFDPKKLVFSYEDISLPAEEKALCKTFFDCPYSIRIKGKYLVVLYTDDGSCETFFQDVPNLSISWVLNPEQNRKLSKIWITALK
ncbi:pilin [Candidatus Parcubacteria bacterium]|nr:pilin [Candidatus Parcubacteria bacterium]